MEIERLVHALQGNVDPLTCETGERWSTSWLLNVVSSSELVSFSIAHAL